MNKAIIRPLILILVFFMGLYVLREPLRNLNSNFSLLKYYYVDPVIAYVKGDKSRADLDKYNEINNNDSDAKDKLPSTIGTNGDINNDNPDKNTGSNSDRNISQTINGGAKGVVISRGDLEADSTNLSIEGVISQTNKERSTKQLPALKTV